MTTLFARARAYLPLSPAERAVLKLVEGLICVAFVAALPVVADALSRQSVAWGDVARAALAAAAVAVLLTLAKYARAHGDPALATALTNGATDLSRAAGLSSPDAGSPVSVVAADGAAAASPAAISAAPAAVERVAG